MAPKTIAITTPKIADRHIMNIIMKKRNIVRINKMRHRDTKRANAVGKMAPTDLHDTGLRTPLICKRITVKLSETKHG